MCFYLTTSALKQCENTTRITKSGGNASHAPPQALNILQESRRHNQACEKSLPQSKKEPVLVTSDWDGNPDM